jgi:hypothetical protein
MGFRDVHGYIGGMLSVFFDINKRWRAWYLGIARKLHAKIQKGHFPWGIETYYRQYQLENL